MTDLARHSVRGAATTLVGQGLRFATQFAAVAVLSRLLPPTDFGTFSMVMSIVGIAAVFGDFGLSLASIQAQDINDKQRANLFWMNVAIGVVASGAVFFCAPLIAVFYGKPSLVPIAQWTAVVFLVNALTPQFRAEATRRLRFVWLSTADVSAQLGGFAVAVVMALAGMGYWALVGQQIAIAVITLIVTASGSSWLPTLPSRRVPMGALYRFGANTFGVQIVNYFTGNVDNIVVGRDSGATQLGYYSRAFQLFQLPLQQIASPMSRVALPILSRLNGTADYEVYVQKIQLILTYTFGGAFFVLIATTSPFIDIVLGHQWAPVKPLFSILAAGGVFQALGYVYYWVFVSSAQTGVQLRYGLIARAIMVAIIIGGGFFGAVGVATAVAVGQTLVWLIYTVFAIPKVGISSTALVATALRPIAVFAAMLVITLPLEYGLLRQANPWVALVALLGVIVVFLGLVVLLAPPVRRDAEFVLRNVRRLRRA
jgi:O-antigen/teichoic acid export membrane protein